MKGLLVIALISLVVSSCYQMHSDDDLRAVPVTNNPNVVPAMDGIGRLMAMP